MAKSISKQDLIKKLQNGPDYFSKDLNKSITGTLDDFYNLKHETKQIQHEVSKGHNPVDHDTVWADDKVHHMSDYIDLNKDNLHLWKPTVKACLQTKLGQKHYRKIKAINTLNKDLKSRKKYLGIEQKLDRMNFYHQHGKYTSDQNLLNYAQSQMHLNNHQIKHMFPKLISRKEVKQDIKSGKIHDGNLEYNMAGYQPVQDSKDLLKCRHFKFFKLHDDSLEMAEYNGVEATLPGDPKATLEVESIPREKNRINHDRELKTAIKDPSTKRIWSPDQITNYSAKKAHSLIKEYTNQHIQWQSSPRLSNRVDKWYALALHASTSRQPFNPNKVANRLTAHGYTVKSGVLADQAEKMHQNQNKEIAMVNNVHESMPLHDTMHRININNRKLHNFDKNEAKQLPKATARIQKINNPERSNRIKSLMQKVNHGPVSVSRGQHKAFDKPINKSKKTRSFKINNSHKIQNQSKAISKAKARKIKANKNRQIHR